MNQTIDVISPIDGSIALRMPASSPAAIARTLDLAKRQSLVWRTSSLGERCAIAERFIVAFERRSEEISQSITECMGRPIRYSPGEVMMICSISSKKKKDASAKKHEENK